MAIPKKKSLLKPSQDSIIKKAKDKSKKDEKVITVAMKSTGTAQLQGLYDEAMFMMGEGFTGPEANAGDINRYYNGLGKARKYGKMLRQRGIMVVIPEVGD